MSRIRANTITNKAATGAPNFPNGLTGTAATFTGVLTYEDVTNVDSVGIVTARQGIRVGAGKSIGSDGAAVVYYGDGSNLSGISVDSTKIETGNTKVETIDTGSDGHVKITTEGSEKARVETDGGVGIGTTTAGTRRLKVLHNADTPLQIHASASNCYMQLGNNSVDNIYLGATGNSLTLHNAGEKFRVGSAGQLGIGGATYGSSGQVLTSGGASAAPTWGTIAGAKIVKVYQGSTSATISTSSTSYADVGLSKTLTPLATNNTFLIQFNFGVMRKTQSTTASMYTRLIVPGGNITWGSGYQLYYHGTDNNMDRGEPPAFWQFIHAPSTTSSIEYKVQWRAENTSGSGFYLYGHRQMIIYELSGGVD